MHRLILLVVILVSLGCSAPRKDVAKYKRGDNVLVVDGIFKGREAVIGLYVGDGVYQLNHIKGFRGESHYIGTLRECEITGPFVHEAKRDDFIDTVVPVL